MFGLSINYDFAAMDFIYGPDSFGPAPELRRLEDIRPSLRDPQAAGPAVVYSIVMDVGQRCDRADLMQRHLLYGMVIYNRGRLGAEPIRSQGHVHAVSASCGESTPELYEIHAGQAIVFMQEFVNDMPGRCFAVHGSPGDLILVPPHWGHATISADPLQPLAFGAWCVRDYGFDYTGVRAHGGLAYFPILNSDNEITWEANTRYQPSQLTVKTPRQYREFHLTAAPIYTQYQQEKDKFAFIARPHLTQKLWENFIP